jgi:signal peptide peptidase SppA
MVFCSSRTAIIPVITINDVISASDGASFKKVNKLIESAFKIPNIKTLAIIINSPGGSPVQSELIYKRIRFLADENDVEVITFIQDIGASGGYYLALAGDTIYASNSSIVGSIGVVSSGFGFQELIKNYGVERRVYTQGENKALLDPFLPQRDSDVEILTDISKDIHNEFIDLVKSRRGANLNIEEVGLFSGKIWSGKRAKEIGLIDEIGDIHSVLHKKYGKNMKLKYISEPKSLLSSLKSIIGIDMLAKSIVQTLINQNSSPLKIMA